MKQNNTLLMLNKSLFFNALIAFLLFVVSCSNPASDQNKAAVIENESKELASWLEKNGNYIASAEAPAVISAGELYSLLGNNILLIDLRDAEQYAAGYIDGAINLGTDKVIDFFMQRIDPVSFEKIIFVDNRGQLSAYVTSVMRMIGYNNVFSLRFGMSSWNAGFAAAGWDKVIGNELTDKLDYESHAKNPKGSAWPKLSTGASRASSIALLRAQQLLSKDAPAFLIDYKDLMKNPSAYYIINYWPEEQYLKAGHLPGAVQYTPKVSLHSTEDLLTLPVDKPIVVYCYTGQHAANVTAWLRMLGYDAHSLIYGSNAFMHQVLTGPAFTPSNFWGDAHKHNFPLSNSAAPAAATISTENKAAKGGC